jgi:methionyl-tRNA formyltransferase
MKLVVLTSHTPGNVWLVNQLLAAHDVCGIVLERRAQALTRREKANRRRRLVQRYGLFRAVNRLGYTFVRSRLLNPNDDAVVTASLFPGAAPVEYARTVPTIVVESANDSSAVQFIREHAPDVLAVCGTSVLKPHVFTLAPRGAINIHTGITPEYRSADPIFWALYRGEPEKVGVTIHYIDAGVDTGPVISQERVPVYADDSLATLYVRCLRHGSRLYSRALSGIEAGSVATTVRPNVGGRAYLAAELGLFQYLIFRWRFWRLTSGLPRGSAVAHTGFGGTT